MELIPRKEKVYFIVHESREPEENSRTIIPLYYTTEEQAYSYLHEYIYPREVKKLQEELKEEKDPYGYPYWKFEINKVVGKEKSREELWLKISFTRGEEYYGWQRYYIEEEEFTFYYWDRHPKEKE